jgi:F0F1-type ATP synthase assembly protein I
MSGRSWLEAVERELNRRRLPRQEVARLVAELSDHLADVIDSQNAAGLFPARDPARVKSLEDVMEKHMSMEARVAESLGSPAVIAETAVAEFRRRRSLLSRSWLAAFCTFALLPLPALCLAWTLTILSLQAIAEVCKWCGLPGESPREITPLLVFVVHVVLAAILVGPASLVAALFGRLARKTSHCWRWGLVASLLVALTTALVTTTATFSETPGKSSIMFGVPLSGNAKFWKSLVQPAHFGQFLLPLGVGVLILRRSAGGPAQPAGRQPLSL